MYYLLMSKKKFKFNECQHLFNHSVEYDCNAMQRGLLPIDVTYLQINIKIFLNIFYVHKFCPERKLYNCIGISILVLQTAKKVSDSVFGKSII